jgi:RNA polymerase sigma-70 factor (ECF subfamily)
MMHPVLALFGISGGELMLILVAILFLTGAGIVLVSAIAYVIIRSLKPQSAPTRDLKATEAAQAPARETLPADVPGSQFYDVNLTGAEFKSVNLSNARFQDVNLSNATFTGAQLGGAAFKQIGLPPGPDGSQERQRPVRFEEMMLCDSLFRNVDLSNVRIVNCDLTGMTIDGTPVNELLEAYRRQQNIRPQD